jgi:Holliday junction resolvasome RuvABC endonuclease subunit
MIVVGIDPSLTATGIAIIRDGIPDQPTKIGYPGTSGASDADRARRCVALVREITTAVRRAQPDLVLIESPAYAQSLPSTCDRNFLWMALVHEFAVCGPMKYARITPTARAQFAAGNGHASKLSVINAVNGWWPHLNLRTEPASRMQDGEADAMVIATMGVAQYEPELLPFPILERQRNNLEAVAWPITV